MNRLPNLLIIDDDHDDIFLMKETLESVKLKINVFAVNDGEEALSFLRKEPPFEDKPTPDLIFLDLNMPKVDGKTVLGQVKKDPVLKSIPVVILTTSEDSLEIKQCYDMGANCYATKPVNMAEFEKVIKQIEEFWFTIVRIPKS